jgi:type VI secretion system protein ImpH
LDRSGFERLLPDRLALQRLVSLVRTYVGFEIGFAINPVLAADSVPPLRLDSTADPKPRLGWNTWLEPMAGGRRRTTDAADSVFEAEIIEAQGLATPGARSLATPGARSLATKERAA